MSQSFARGLTILDLFTVDRPSLTIEEIAQEIGTSSITAYRYVTTLADSNLVIYEFGEVKLSAKILRYVNLFWEHDHLVSIAKDHLAELQAATNETAAICKKEQNNVICLYRLESPQSLRSSFKIGQKMSIHAGAFARAIAAYLPKNELEVIKNNIQWTKFTDNTIISHDAYFERLKLIKERGYDISQGEVDPGVIGMAAPVIYNNKVVASAGLAMPSVRLDPNKLPFYIEMLKKTADNIAQDMVYQQAIY